MKYSLEKMRFFPALAWATVIGFAFVTYTLSQELQRETDLMVAMLGSIQL